MTLKHRQQAALLGGQPLDPSLVNDHSHHLARVIDAFPERNLIDVMLLDGGGVVRDVQVMVPSGSSKTGLVDLVNVSYHPQDAFFIPETSNEKKLENDGESPAPGIRPRIATSFKEVEKGFNSYAVIVFLSGKVANPICIGFIYPETSEMMFFEQHKIDRHHSDIYSLIDEDGNYDHVFPDGTFLRVGEGTVRTDLVGKDTNQKWKTKADDPATQEPAKTIHLEHASGTTVTISPTGSVSINVAENYELNVSGNKSETVDGDSTEFVVDTKTIEADIIELMATAVNLETTTMLLEMQSGQIDATDLTMDLAKLIINGSSKIELSSADVKLGIGASFGVLPGELWQAWAATHTHSALGQGPPNQTPPPPSNTVKVSL